MAGLIADFYGIKSKNPYPFLEERGIFPSGEKNAWSRDTVRRYQAAIVLSKIILEKGLELYAGNVNLRDVSPDEVYYIPVKLTVGLGLLSCRDGYFHPFYPVYKGEIQRALKGLRRLSEVENTE